MAGARGRRPNIPLLNRASQLATGLSMWVPVQPGVVRDVVSGTAFTLQGDADITTTANPMGGTMLQQNSGTAPYGNYTASSVFGFGTSNCSLAVWVPRHSVPTNVGGALLKIGNATTGVGIGLGGAGFSDIFDNIGEYIGVLFEGSRWIRTGVTIDRTRDNVLGLTLPVGGGGLTVYLNGTQIYSDGSGSPNAASSSTGIFGYNNIRRVWAAASDFMVWNRALSASEHRVLAGPSRWDLCRVHSRRSYAIIGGAPATNRRRRVLLAA